MTGPVSAPSGARSAARFIGRERELAELRAGLDDAIAGRGRLFLISGEPGVGKTRLAEEISNDAAARGMRVLWGRCWEGGGAPAYWPLIQILRACVEDRDSAHLEALLGSSASEIARLIPELKLSLPSLEETEATTDSESARFLLFDAVATLLKNVARSGPLLIVIDDLHDADQPSLQMLRFIARAAKDVSLPMIGTYRDAEVKRSPPLGKLVGALIREGRSLSLTGLSKTEVGDFIASRTGRTADERLVADLYRATDGNALYVEGVVRLLESEGKLEPAANARDGFRIPDGVRESIRRRLATLSDEANSLLSIASVIGNEFEMRLLERVSGHSPEQIVEQLDEAARIGILRKGSPGLVRQQFSHALIREVLYDDLAANRRIELHGDIGAAIEEIHKDDLQPHLAALAHHFREAGSTDKAIDYSIRAGNAAYPVFAYEEAGAHWRAALELMDEQGGGDRKRRARILWLLGDELVSSGRKAVEYLEAAAPLFEELGDNERATDVHSRLGNYLSVVHLGAMDLRRAMDHFKKAEVQLAAQPESQRHAIFYLRMGAACAWAGRIGDGFAAAKRAMEMGEHLSDDLLRSYGEIHSSLFLVRSGSVTQGLRLADQARQRAEPVNDTMLGSTVAWIGGGNYALLGDPRESQDWKTRELAKPRTAQSAVRRVLLHRQLANACIEMGELSKARACLAEAKVAEAKGSRYLLYFFEGEWERAEKLLTAWSERGRMTGNRQDDLGSATALARLHRLTGERAQAMQFLQKALDISVEVGDIPEELKTRSTLATMAADASDAGEALPHLQRCRQIVSAGENWRGIAGSVERAEAVVAAAQGEFARADGHFERAIATFRHYCRPWEEADTLQYWGRALLAAGERARAIEKFDAAIEIYRSRGAGTRFIEYVMADKMRSVEPLTDTPSGEHRGSAEDSIFRREGDYWTVAYEGKTWRLKDAKGFHYMAHLLGHPGEEIRALDLVARIAGGRDEVVDSVSAEDFARSDTLAGDLGHAGEILDAQAKAAYGRRLTELKDELEEARELGNAERAEQAQDEIEALGRELKGAIGLAGRDRYAASSTERARIAVTRAIHHALSKIAENDASLGKLLSTTIKTGTACSYVPDLRFPISWQLSLNAERARSSR